MPLFRKSVPQDPLVVSMTGTRLGHRVLIVPSKHDDVVLAVAAKVGLTGHVVVAADESRRAALTARALNAGVLIETAGDLEGAEAEPPFDIGILDLRGIEPALDTAVLASLHGRLRHGGRLAILMTAPGGGLSGLLAGSQAAPDTTPQTRALLAAGFRTARVLAIRERIVFIEALKG